MNLLASASDAERVMRCLGSRCQLRVGSVAGSFQAHLLKHLPSLAFMSFKSTKYFIWSLQKGSNINNQQGKDDFGGDGVCHVTSGNSADIPRGQNISLFLFPALCLGASPSGPAVPGSCDIWAFVGFSLEGAGAGDGRSGENAVGVLTPWLGHY